MPNFSDDDLDSFVVDIKDVGKRSVVIDDYTTEHLDQVGMAWQALGESKKYLPIPSEKIDLDGYSVDGEEKMLVTGISREFFYSQQPPLKIKAPMSLGGKHWVGFTIDIIDIDDQTDVIIKYMDSLNNAPDFKDQADGVEAEYSRICGILVERGFVISNKSGVYVDALQQSDPVSCGAYFMENSSRVFGDSHFLGKRPSEVEIRADQLVDMNADSLKSVSQNVVLYDKMFAEAKTGNAFSFGRFKQLMSVDREFLKAVQFEYSLTEAQLKSGAESHVALVQSAFERVRRVFAMQKQMLLDCQEVLDGKFSVDKIEEVVKRRWLQVKDSDPKYQNLSTGDFLHFNKGRIKSYTIELTSRAMSSLGVKTLKEFREQSNPVGLKSDRDQNGRTNFFWRDIKNVIIGVTKALGSVFLACMIVLVKPLVMLKDVIFGKAKYKEKIKVEESSSVDAPGSGKYKARFSAMHPGVHRRSEESKERHRHNSPSSLQQRKVKSGSPQKRGSFRDAEAARKATEHQTKVR